MATKQQLRNQAALANGNWDEAADNIDAPAGRLWTANGCHTIALPWGTDDEGNKWTASERYAYAIESLEYGSEPCTNPDCDACAENECDACGGIDPDCATCEARN